MSQLLAQPKNTKARSRVPLRPVLALSSRSWVPLISIAPAGPHLSSVARQSCSTTGFWERLTPLAQCSTRPVERLSSQFAQVGPDQRGHQLNRLGARDPCQFPGSSPLWTVGCGLPETPINRRHAM